MTTAPAGAAVSGVRYTLLALLFTFLWTSAFIVVKIGLRDAPPLFLMSSRFFVAGGALLGYAAWRGRPLPARARDWWPIVLLGLLNFAGYLGFTALSLREISAGMGAVLASTNPLLLALGAAWLLGERLTVLKVAGLLVSFGGVTWIMESRLGSDNTPRGMVFAFLAVASLVAGTLLVPGGAGLPDRRPLVGGDADLVLAPRPRRRHARQRVLLPEPGPRPVPGRPRAGRAAARRRLRGGPRGGARHLARAARMTFAWAAGAGVIAAASFVMGLAGFGIALVALAFLPYLMAPADAIVILTIYALVFAAVLLVQLRRDVEPRAIAALLAGTLAGTPLGVWGLAALPASALNRLIGLMLVVACLLEARGLYPRALPGRGWALAAGAAAGVIGGAVGTPGPPVILYAATQRWSARAIKANLQAFFVVNQGVILVGYWWAGLLTREAWSLTASYAVPAAAGAVAGALLFERVDQARFRLMVFLLLLASGLVLLVRG
ncbi:MAG: TSUP family transporter [Candidatus Rokubacteria bacterium]|nr:TSUP family transporter [Candidatus Rokubacteria bacterium]